MMPTSLFLILLFLSLLCLTEAEILTRATSCPNVLNYYRTNAIKRVGPYGFSPFAPFVRRGGPIPAALSAQPEAAKASTTETPPQAGIDFSETNVQVEGVDEPDIIKTDGTRVFTLRGNKFFVVNAKDGGAAGETTGSIILPTFGSEMLIEKDRVLVISRDFGSLDGKTQQPGPSVAKSFFIRPFPVPELTVVYHISVAGAKPRLISTLRMEGSYISSREVGGIARIVMKFDPTQKIPFRYPRGGAATAEATNVNKNIIGETTISTWLPRYTLKIECSRPGCVRVFRGFITDCDDIFLPKEKFSGFGLLTVATLRILGTIKPRNSASIVSNSGDVYSTTSSLYVATTQYRYDFAANSVLLGPAFKTFLHKFRLGQYGARYAGSGEVFGSVLNQFSMHENDRVFFVATTEGAPWWNSRDTSKSKVTAFKLKKRKLVKIGEVGNLGIGERIFAVRYIERTAYVVTFRQIDPLYIIDLSKPWKLRVTGELKIPGFSSYLHPIAPGRLLGVGQEATLEGRTTGAKVSLFDVSDVTEPKEIAGWTLKGSFTTAQFDHRAFLFWKPESVAVLPVSVYSRSPEERFVGSIVLEVSDRIVERGRFSHKNCCGLSSPPGIERNFVLGKTHLWSLSRELLQVNNLRDLALESTIDLPSSNKIAPKPIPL